MSEEETKEVAAEEPEKFTGMTVRNRRRLAIILVLVATLTGIVSLVSLWVKREVYDTDQWVATSSALLANEEIRTELANYLTAQIFAGGNVQAELAQLLPPKAAPLAGPAASGLSQLFNKAVNQILQTSAIQNLWEEANRQASTAFIAIANNEPIGTGILGEAQSKLTAAQAKTGATTLDLTQIRSAVTEKLGIQPPKTGLGSGEAAKAAIEAGNGQAALQVIAPNEISTIQDVSSLIQKLATILPLLTFFLLALAVFISRGTRLRTLTSVGLALIVVGVATLTIRDLLGTTLVNQLAATDSVKPAISAAYGIGTELLKTMAVATIAYGIVVLLAVALGSQTRAATWIRQHVAPALRDPMWASAGTALVLLILIWWSPTPAFHELAGVVLMSVFVIGGVVALRRQTLREFPGPEAETAELT